MPTAIARPDSFPEMPSLSEAKGAEQVEEQSEVKSVDSMRKPFIPPPVSCFILCSEIEKIEITSQMNTMASGKQEVEALDKETTEAHKKMLDEWKRVMEKEKNINSWSISIQVFSWVGSFVGIISGAILIATGIGVVAGALLITAGVITLTNQIMEITKGWEAMKKLLPGDNEQEKYAVIAWMQMGIALLCMVLSGAGVIYGGYKPFGEGMQTAMGLIGGIATAGQGASTIGQAIDKFFYNNAQGEAKRYERILAELKYNREDVMERIDDIPDRLERIFEFISTNERIKDRLNAAFQAAWR